MADYSIRPLRPDEWEILRDIRLEALRTDPGAFGSNLARELEYTQAQWQDWLNQDKKCAFGLFQETDLVGLISIRQDLEDPEGQIAIIVANYIRTGHRGKGLNAQLYKACFEWARTQPNISRIAVSHRSDNVASRASILSAGFTEVGREDKTWPDGVTCDHIWYGLSL